MTAVWWKSIPGLDWRDRPDSREFANRVGALACAFRIQPLTERGRYNGTPTAHAAIVFLEWLAKAGDDWDAYWRRLALAFACDQLPPPGTPPATVLQAARSIHEAITPRTRGGASSHQ